MAITAKDIDTVKSSLQRCLKIPGFLEYFYEVFLASSPEVREKLKNITFPRQIIMLKGSLHIMILYASGQLSDEGSLKQLAVLHDKSHRDIKPELYLLWLNSMVDAVKHADPEFNEDIENAWRHSMQPGIEYMSSFY